MSEQPQLTTRIIPIDFLFFDDLRRPFRVRQDKRDATIWLHYWNTPSDRSGNWVTLRPIVDPKELANMAYRRETSLSKLEAYSGGVNWHTPFK